MHRAQRTKPIIGYSVRAVMERNRLHQSLRQSPEFQQASANLGVRHAEQIRFYVANRLFVYLDPLQDFFELICTLTRQDQHSNVMHQACVEGLIGPIPARDRTACTTAARRRDK